MGRLASALERVGVKAAVTSAGPPGDIESWWVKEDSTIYWKEFHKGLVSPHIPVLTPYCAILLTRCER